MTVEAKVSEADIARLTPGMTGWFTTLGGDDQARPRRWSSKVRQVLQARPRGGPRLRPDGSREDGAWRSRRASPGWSP